MEAKQALLLRVQVMLELPVDPSVTAAPTAAAASASAAPSQTEMKAELATQTDNATAEFAIQTDIAALSQSSSAALSQSAKVEPSQPTVAAQAQRYLEELHLEGVCARHKNEGNIVHLLCDASKNRTRMSDEHMYRKVGERMYSVDCVGIAWGVLRLCVVVSRSS